VTLDIGTAESGFGFVFRNTPQRIVAPNFPYNNYPKIRTDILFKTPDLKTVLAMGDEADSKYVDDPLSTALFRRFKMRLHELKSADNVPVVKSHDGRYQLRITDLFAA